MVLAYQEFKRVEQRLIQSLGSRIESVEPTGARFKRVFQQVRGAVETGVYRPGRSNNARTNVVVGVPTRGVSLCEESYAARRETVPDGFLSCRRT